MTARTVAFVVRGVAAPQGSFKAILSRSTGRAFLKQSCPRTMPWRQEVAGAAANAVNSCQPGPGWPTTSPVDLVARFVLPRPAGHMGKKGLRPSAPAYPSKKPDLSKLLRAIEDAMTGIIYVDDAQIVSHELTKRYDDGIGPRVEITVTEYVQ